MFHYHKLRSGNLFYNSGNLVRISVRSKVPRQTTRRYEIGDDGVRNLLLVMHSSKGMEPIPLTENILKEALGFHDYNYQLGYIGISLENLDFVLKKPDKEIGFGSKFCWQITAGGVPLIKPIDYVHELQNLVYAVYGHELVVNYAKL